MMRHPLSSLTAVLLIGALLLAAAPPRAFGRDRPGDFDFYLLALSVAPSFCELTGRRKHKAQCEETSDEGYRATPLTVHGLWPNKRDRSNQDQPQACSRQPLELPDDLAAALQRVMPGIADGLDRYEWNKHGVCSGLSPEAYFQRVVALAEAANQTIGTVMRERGFFGKPMAVTALLAAVQAKNPDLAEALVVNCQFSRQQRGGARSRAYVDEIRILIAKELPTSPGADGWPANFVRRSEVGYSANSGCPRGVGFLPARFEE
jgi:ribonuclease T2